MKKKRENVKLYLSIGLLVISLMFGAYSLISPPQGVIDSSVLMFTGEALAFVSMVLGIDMVSSKSNLEK
jgi:hypothetical protein